MVVAVRQRMVSPEPVIRHRVSVAGWKKWNGMRRASRNANEVRKVVASVQSEKSTRIKFAGGSCEELERRTAEAGGILGDRSFRAVGVRKYFVCQRDGCICRAQVGCEFIRGKSECACAEGCRTERIRNECRSRIISEGINPECIGFGHVRCGFIGYTGVEHCFGDGH
jgi:hypothetical protein